MGRNEPYTGQIFHLEDQGPFDIVGDVHGCYAELVELLERMGYRLDGQADRPARKVIFVGDLVDRGPEVPAVLRLVMDWVEKGWALCVPGNHDDKLLRYLQGRRVKIANGLEISIRQLGEEPASFRYAVQRFLNNLPHHLILDGWQLAVAHGGLSAELLGQDTGEVRAFALFGKTLGGQLDELGLPIRLDWAAEYQGHTRIIYGHTPIHQPAWKNNTINIDTGCVFGGALTALRYPELELVSVKAHYTYAHTRRPFLPPEEYSPLHPDLAADVSAAAVETPDDDPPQR